MLKLFSACLITAVAMCTAISQGLPCDLIHSLNITAGIKYLNGSIFHEGFEYTKDQYGSVNEIILRDNTIKQVETHLRGCMCKIISDMPCLPFCCPPGFVKKGVFSECELFDHDIILNTSNTGSDQINAKENFRLVQTPKCDKSFNVDNDEDEWSLLMVILLI